MTQPKLWPVYTELQAEQLKKEVLENIEKVRHTVGQVLQAPKTYDYAIRPLQEAEYELHLKTSELGHMHSMFGQEWREPYAECTQALSALSSFIGQNSQLYEVYAQVRQQPGLNDAQIATLDHALRDFKLSGVALPEEKRKLFTETLAKLRDQETEFEHKIIDATVNWYTIAENPEGLPENFIVQAQEKAKERGLKGVYIGLDGPSVITVLTYAKDRNLRKTVFEAYQTRASEIGPNAGKYDNSEVMVKILQLRENIAKLAGFPDYAEYSLASKMAEHTNQVEAFLLNIAHAAKPYAQKELSIMKEKAASLGFELRGWDNSYIAELLRVEKYALSQEELRSYFPYPIVFQGLCDLINQLFGVVITEEKIPGLWTKEAKCYGLRLKGEVKGYLLVDVYAREHKREGAWMDSYRSYHKNSKGHDVPVVYLICNFRSPGKDGVAYLTHDDVITLFHEMGHSLHGLLSFVEEINVSGISGVEWDAVECPSQWLENFAYEKSVLQSISAHEKTKESLPDSMIEKIHAAKNFNSGLFLLRQVEFALFDIRAHKKNVKTIDDIMECLAHVRQEVAVVKAEPFNRFGHTFSHIFAGGYAAGYYSYLWAEVLALDIYQRFVEKGYAEGPLLLEQYLGQGGVYSASILFEKYMGRKPDPKGLLRAYGLV